MFIISDGVNSKTYDNEHEALESALVWSKELHGAIISVFLNGFLITRIWV